MLERQGDGVSQEDKTILAQKEFTYEIQQPESVKISIESVNADFKQNTLVLVLNVSDETQIQIYEGFIVDESKQRILDFGPALYPGRQISVPLPKVIAQAKESQEYQVTVRLITKDDLRSEATGNFTPGLPPKVSLLTRIYNGLMHNSVVVLGIFAILASVLTWRLLDSQRAQRKRMAQLPRPPIEHTDVILPIPPGLASGANAPPTISQAGKDLSIEAKRPPVDKPLIVHQFRLRLTILNTPQPVPEMERFIAAFPFVIGRREADFNIPSDVQVSRHHAEIMLRDMAFYLTDLDSLNGTYVDGQRLQPNQPFCIIGKTQVGLGHFTRLTLEPMP